MVNAFEIVAANPDLLIVRDLPYTIPGWAAMISGAFLAIFACIRWWFGLPRLTVGVLIVAGFLCILLGGWLIGLQSEFSFLRRESAIEIHKNWFGRTVSDERLTYATPPVADIVVTKRTTRQIVLRFSDGRVKTLGLSTDRAGYEQAATAINHFLRGASILQ